MNKLLTACFAVVLLAGRLPGGEPDTGRWRLAFQDTFQRKKPGSDWEMFLGSGKIVDGRLHITGSNATAMVNRSFAPDVRVVFEAEADPSLPPCDVACGLAGNTVMGYGYLLQFGGNNNQVNQIICPLRNRAQPRRLQIDRKPPFRIEHGKLYLCEAVKEGPRITYKVNGVRILDVKDQNILGGPNLDHVSIVTWNGLFIDNVRIYDRVEPAPGGPVFIQDPAVLDFGYRWKNRVLTYEGEAALPPALNRAVKAYNARDYQGAYNLFKSVTPPTIESVVGLSYVLGDLTYRESVDDQREAAALAMNVAERHPDDPGMKAFAALSEWFSRVNLVSRDRQNTERIHAVGPADNPFYFKTQLFRARYQLAAAKESGWIRHRKQANALFKSLQKRWPDHTGIAQILGDRIPWGKELIRPESEGPPWARHLQEGLARSHAVMNWWFTVRQTADGQLGGGWGDDVELMRSWGMPACITTAGETAVAGIQRLADGVWTHVLNEMEPTVPSDDFGDVEHSAEPAADTHPLMLLLRYGDPEYVERNMKVAGIYRNVAMGINERGGLQFKSCEYNLTSVNLDPSAAGQNIYHARAMRHCVWLAWLGLPDAQALLLRWAGTLRDAAMAEIGPKPPGYMPFTLFWPSGSIYPPNDRFWLDPKAHYYGTHADKLWKYHNALFSAYFVSRDHSFLEPIDRMMDMAAASPGTMAYDAKLPRDHHKNLLADFSRQASRRVSILHHWLTGSTVHDGSGLSLPLRISLDHDIDRAADEFKRALSRLRYNWELLTEEVLQTDRMDIPGAPVIYGAYTGGVSDLLEDALIPTVAVTWDTPDLNFAALVMSATKKRLRVLVYNFRKETTRIGLRPWLLLPGTYLLSCGESSSRGTRPIAWEKPRLITGIARGTPVYVHVPSHKTWLIDMRLQKSGGRSPLLPDLAVHRRDVRATSDGFIVTVHNIGSAEAGPFDVTLEAESKGCWLEVARVHVAGLPKITDFQPVRRSLRLGTKTGEDNGISYRISVDPAGQVTEANDGNNIVILKH